MNRILGHVFAMLGVGALAAMTPSCAHNDQSIFIKAIAAPPKLTTAGDSCVYSPDADQAVLFAGAFDAGLANAYTMVALVGNQLIERVDRLNVRAESNRTSLKGAVVRVTDVSGNSLGEFTSPAQGTIEPASGSSASFQDMFFVGIDSAIATSLRAKLPTRSDKTTVLVNFKAFGVTGGGEDVESDEYTFPVSVCNGCLVDFSTGTDPAQPAPNCAKTAATSTELVFPCFKGQDQPVACQLCQDNALCRP